MWNECRCDYHVISASKKDYTIVCFDVSSISNTAYYDLQAECFHGRNRKLCPEKKLNRRELSLSCCKLVRGGGRKFWETQNDRVLSEIAN